MRLTLYLDTRLEHTPDGAFYSSSLDDFFWSKYLDVFDSVRLVTRVRDVPFVDPGAHRVDKPQIRVYPVPDFQGPWDYLRRARSVNRTAREAFTMGDAVMLQGCATVASPVEPMLHRLGYPFGLNVVGDPYDVFAPGAVRHVLSPVFRSLFALELRRFCVHSCAVVYVTDRTLQHRYPCGGYSLGISNVSVPAEAFVPVPRQAAFEKRDFTVITVGSLAQMYKAPDVLISSVAECMRRGLSLRLVLVGDGKHKPELQALAASLGIAGCVEFLGRLPAGEAVRNELDKADLFVLPSRTEGLPRAMIEAMARALPCIGSTVGGIPELLSPEDMVPPGDAGALADRMHEMLADPRRMAYSSAKNLQKAGDYRQDVLHKRWVDFSGYLLERTEEWLKDHGR